MSEHPLRASTPALPASHPRDASDLGGFSMDGASDVLVRLAEDVKAIGSEKIYEAYAANVPVRKSRRRPARQTLIDLEAERLSSNDDLARLVEVLYCAGYQRLLAKHGVQFPAYNVFEEYFVNTTQPWGPTIRMPKTDRRWLVLGRQIGFPIGVPASVLTPNTNWVLYWARAGYNVITYKTVRSRAFQAHPLPNWAFAPSQSVPLAVDGDRATQFLVAPTDWAGHHAPDISTANSFGVPSVHPSDWQEDVRVALSYLRDDQLLILSVMGDLYPDAEGDSEAALIQDFVDVALLAQQTGVAAIELNLSCPNTLRNDEVLPPVCDDVELVEKIVKAVRAALVAAQDAPARLVLKVSYMATTDLEDLVTRCLGHFDGIAGINTLQLECVTEEGSPTFRDRPQAGVSGIAIRDHAIRSVEALALIRFELDAHFDILGMGGVTDPESFRSLFMAGCSAVQSATGTFANPYLARDCVRTLASDLPRSAPPNERVQERLEEVLVEVLGTTDLDVLDEVSIAGAFVNVAYSDVVRTLDSLAEQGRIVKKDEHPLPVYAAI